jgi:hypothetical protein
VRTIGLILLAAATLAAVLAAIADIWDEEGKPVQGATFTVVGLDMNTTGNSCPNNCTPCLDVAPADTKCDSDGTPAHCTAGDDCSLGTIDRCVEVHAASEDEFLVDVFVEGLPSGDSILGAGYDINFPDTVVKTIAQTHTDPLVNLLDQPGSSLMDVGDGVPDTVSPHKVTVADMGYAEYNPPFSHGVLGRYTFKVLPGAPAGFYALTLSKVGLGRDVPPAGPIFDPGGHYANEIDEDADTVVDDDQVWDGNFVPQYGIIAVDVACAAYRPPPSPTITPTVTSTVTPSPAVINLVTGWNYVCYLGAEQAVSNALADIGTGVLAVYHLRPDQGFDTWFPGRPNLGSMASVSPYEPLFILMANDAAWPQQPATTPPASLDLAQGWNSVCYSGQTKDVETATAAIAGQFDVLYVLAPDQSWKLFVTARPDVSDLTELQRFAPVLVLRTQTGGTQWALDP